MYGCATDDASLTPDLLAGVTRVIRKDDVAVNRLRHDFT